MAKETLDEILEHLTQDFLEERKRKSADADADDMEQFTEMIEKYTRQTDSDEER